MAAHSKHWSKFAFSMFSSQNTKKRRKKVRNLVQNLAEKVFFCLHQNTGGRFYSQKKHIFIAEDMVSYAKS